MAGDELVMVFFKFVNDMSATDADSLRFSGVIIAIAHPPMRKVKKVKGVPLPLR